LFKRGISFNGRFINTIPSGSILQKIIKTLATKKHFNFSITAVPQLTNPDYTIDDRANMLLEKTYFELTKKNCFGM